MGKFQGVPPLPLPSAWSPAHMPKHHFTALHAWYLYIELRELHWPKGEKQISDKEKYFIFC